MLPEGVFYIHSWINIDLRTCFQVMESDASEKINSWISYWVDLADFEVIPVMTFAEVNEKFLDTD